MEAIISGFGKYLKGSNYIIYSIINRRNNKRYIGMTNDIKRRAREHYNALRDFKHRNASMQNDFKNINDFDIEVIDIAWSKEDAIATEKHYIKEYKTENILYGYNETSLEDENKKYNISQCTKEGLASAKARGREGGRPNKRNDKADLVELMYKQGYKIKDIVSKTGLGRTTVYRILKELKDN